MYSAILSFFFRFSFLYCLCEASRALAYLWSSTDIGGGGDSGPFGTSVQFAAHALLFLPGTKKRTPPTYTVLHNTSFNGVANKHTNEQRHNKKQHFDLSSELGKPEHVRQSVV